MIKIESVDTTPVFGRSDDRSDTYSKLRIDPVNLTCDVFQQENSGCTSSDDYHNMVLTYCIDHDGDERINSTEVKTFLESKKGQQLLERICAGWDSEYDGRNYVGFLNDDADEAAESLIEELEYFQAEVVVLMDIEEWMDSYDYSSITASTTDEKLRFLAEELVSEAEERNIIINRDVYDYLVDYRDDLE